MNQNKSFWKDEVAFYLDGVSFVFKHVRRRKMSEGLLVTGKGSKELAGGKRPHNCRYNLWERCGSQSSL
jgi:hypothetical protein